MRAINLIPADMQRGGGAGAAGRSGGAVYILLGALIGLVGMAALYGLTAHKVSQRESQTATVARLADVTQARASALAPYVAVQAARTKRVGLVSSLIDQRFDWSVAMSQVAEALPRDTTLTSLKGTDLPGGGTGTAAAGAGSGLRSALPVPAVELSGCSPTQPRVAATIQALRNIPGANVVSLGSSQVPGAGTGSGSGSGAGSGAGPAASTASVCSKTAPTFQLVVFYNNPTAPNAPEAAAAPQSHGVTPAAVTQGVAR